MPPPMPLSGTSRLNSAGSQSRRVSACSKTGRMRSQASAAVVERVDPLPHRGDELAHERRVEHVLVRLERRQPVVVVQVAHACRAWRQ